MTITTADATRTFTEADLIALASRFEIRSAYGRRRFYVDGLEVTEPEYLRQFEAATGEAVARPACD